VQLRDGWQLERVDSPTSLVPVDGVLRSPNPVTLSVFSGKTTMVTFQFETTGMQLTFAPGSIDIGVNVATCDPAPPAGVELNVIGNHDFEAGTAGWIEAGDGSSLLQSNSAHCGQHSARVALNHVGAAYELLNVDIDASFTFSVWVLHHQASSLQFQVGTGDLSIIASQSFDVPPDSWQQLTGNVGSLAGEDLEHYRFFVYGEDDSAQGEFLIDDAFAVPH
jgi:hypothetical protein